MQIDIGEVVIDAVHQRSSGMVGRGDDEVEKKIALRAVGSFLDAT